MNNSLLSSGLIIKPHPTKDDISATIIDKSGELIPEKDITSKRFGIIDLWNIRRKGRRRR